MRILNGVGLAVALLTVGCPSAPNSSGTGDAGSSGDAGALGADSGTADGGPGPSVDAKDPCAPVLAKTTFTDAIADSAWFNVDLTPSQGMAGVLEALTVTAAAHATQPVRVRLAPGDYAPTAAGVGSLYLFDLSRTQAAPLLLQATDPQPDATRLSQGFNLVKASYIAIDGVTIGPKTVGAYHQNGGCDVDGNCFHDAPKPLAAEAGIHVSGIALNPTGMGLQNGHLDFTVYGRYQPAHHILVSRVTIQNVFDDTEPSGAGAAGAGADGIKFNQTEFAYVVDSTIRQTSRHGIDTVAVHTACYFRNTFADIGLGLGTEAKGGSIDVAFDSNVLVNVRRLELGGENTDATFYWSAEPAGSAEHYAYEGRRIVARNNLIIDSREGAIEFSGCHDCAAVNNTVAFSAGFVSDQGGDAVREVDSMINRDGAGSECINDQGDGVTDCWGVGPYPTDLVTTPGENGASRVLDNARNSLENNVFVTATARWGDALNPYNHPNSTHSHGLVTVDYNFWWNGGMPMNDPNDGSWLPKGMHSFTAGDAPNPGIPSADPGTFTRENLVAYRAAALTAFTPGSASPLKGRGHVTSSAPTYDARQSPRATSAPTIGALE